MLDDAATPGKAIEMATPSIPQFQSSSELKGRCNETSLPQTDRHGIPVLQRPYEPDGQPMLCKRCGRPLTDLERQADGMGLCCRYQEPHRRRIRVFAVHHDGSKTYTLYSLTNAGKTIGYEVRINTETGEFSCTCPDHKYRGNFCKHCKRALAYETRRQKEERRCEARKAKVYEHSCPQCLGYFAGPDDCPTCAGRGTVREVW